MNGEARAFIIATKSFASFAPTCWLTTSTFGTVTTSAIGVRSLIGSKLSLMRCGAIACPVLVATSSVWPSCVALAVTSAAMVLDAPGRFSTTKGCLNASLNFSASMRATISVPPPADAPTITFTGLVGYCVCAAAVALVHATRPRSIALTIVFVGCMCQFPFDERGECF